MWKQCVTLVAAAATFGALGCSRAVNVESESAGAVAVTPVNSRTLPAGVDIEVALDQPIGTKHSSVGQEFRATVLNSVHAQNGRVAVPAGAKAYGHVTGLHGGSVDRPAAIRLAFDRLVFDGRSYPFEASVTSTQLQTAREPGVRGRDVGIGAAAGGVLGAIIGEGDIGKILGGAVLGAGAGTVVSLGRQGTEPTLPAGTRLNVRTTQTVALR
jgi:hypothetical protein